VEETVNSGKNGPSGPNQDPSGPSLPDPRPTRESVVRVLLVENSNVETEYLQGLLSKAYFTTHHVTRVSLLAEALDLLGEDRFDVLLIDLKRPAGAELEALQQIQSIADDIGLPVVLVTETEEESLALDSPGEGTPNYLIRGEFQSRILIRSIQQAIDRQRMLNRIREAEERELHLTTHDQLTGLPNRYLFVDRLSQALHSSRRHRDWLGVLFMDLDRFKSVNETLGQTVGDQLLQAVSRRLQGCLRATDTIARVSGDTFAVMLPSLTKGLDAASVAQNIEDGLRPPFRLAGRELQMTCSIGIAVYPDDGSDADMLMNGAETALESAKAGGGNTRRFFTSDMNASSLRLLTLESELRKAITRDQDQLIIEYQPIVDGHSGRIQEAEALVRWVHPEMGIVAPEEFIPVAETRGLIIPLGAWVLNQVCRQIRQWRDDGHRLITVTVNVSPAQFWRTDFLGLVMQILQDTGAKSNQLQLEITENSAMREVDLVGEALHALRQLQIRTSIDNFGTGFSSLNVLRRLPLDSLKIERNFVKECTQDRGGAAIATAIIGLARNLGMRVVAEGVETEDQRRFLLGNDCSTMQGFLFSHPLPVDRFTRLLAGGQILPLAEDQEAQDAETPAAEPDLSDTEDRPAS
jgi:diguanylate cyclase (GGDEF)-like protein